MKGKKSTVFVLLNLIILLMLSGCITQQLDPFKYQSTEDVTLKVKEGNMVFNVTIQLNETQEFARLWIPYPVSNNNQQIKDVIITGNYNYSGIYSDGEYGNMILYAEWISPKEDPYLNLYYYVQRWEIYRKNFPDQEDTLPIELKQYLAPTNLGPTTGVVKETADVITRGQTTILGKAVAIYDYLIEYGERDVNLSFCGDGDVCKLLEDLRGKCVDFSSVFVALARSVGVPAREILGTRISKDGDITGAYHCRAEFYLPGFGWVPVDPSDVAKLMLNEDLEIDDPKVIETRDYYFGAQTETYVDLSTGRDVTLNPEQDSDPLNYFMYPYAEVDGEPLDSISQEYLRYTVTFNQS